MSHEDWIQEPRMCTNPGTLPDGTKFACRKCWQCRQTYVDDWAGRCIAESKVNAACHAITLTYGHDLHYGSEDHARAAMLTYSDVQKFIRSLRDGGYPVRYLVAGEYGPLKGRSHWHILIFWEDKIPPLPEMERRVKWEWWEHGWSYFDYVNYRSASYICKYIQKDRDDTEKQSYFQMSKNPPLGTKYFDWLAKQHVLQMLAPQDLFYYFDECRNKEGEKIKYRMHRKTALNFIEAYLRHWQELHPKIHAPWSQLVEDYADRLLQEKKPTEEEDKRWMADLKIELRQRQRLRKAGMPPASAPFGQSPVFDPVANAFFVEYEGERYYWTTDDYGETRLWRTMIVSAGDAQRNVARLLQEESSNSNEIDQFVKNRYRLQNE